MTGKGDRMRMIVKQPGESTGHIVNVRSLSDIEHIIGGQLFRIRMDSDTIFMNRAGWVRGMPLNICHPVWGGINGPIVVAGNDRASFKDCNMDLPKWAKTLQTWEAMSAG